jgi:uncharacterized protein
VLHSIGLEAKNITQSRYARLGVYRLPSYWSTRNRSVDKHLILQQPTQRISGSFDQIVHCYIVMRMKSIALLAIRAYQRFISPYKGFRCAYRVHTGRCSCSGLGYRAVRRYGVAGGIGVLRHRLARCGDVHRIYCPKAHSLSKQAGVCDVGCVDFGGCDAPSGSAICDVCSCFDCGSLGGSKPRYHERNKDSERKNIFVNSH